MCLSPIRIYNPSKKISKNFNQRFEIEVPCGRCSECLTSQKNEWYLRSYWQCQDCFDHNGYVYFDTLTYNDANLPHISDFDSRFKNRIIDYPCFNQQHWKSFIDSLRVNLIRDGWVIDDKLKYFMSSEYGTSEHATHRPHYHILLFVQVTQRWLFKFVQTKKGQFKKVKDKLVDQILDPFELCKYVNKSWNRGFVDNYQHQYVWCDDRNYVKKHTYSPNYTSDDKYLRAVCQYVSKYVMKDSQFQKEIDKRIDVMLNDIAKYSLESGFEGIDYTMSDIQYDYWRKLLRQTQQFHRQSQGFGIYFIDNFVGETYDYFLNTGMVELPVVKKKNFKHMYIPMPKYLFNKIFKDMIFDENGSPYYVYNEEGLNFKYNQTIKNIDLTVKRFNELMKNIVNLYIIPSDEFIGSDGSIVHLTQEECLQKGLAMKKKIDSLLDGRDIKQYVIYTLLYKGRVKSKKCFDNVDGFDKDNGFIDDLEDMIVNQYRDFRYDTDVWYNYQQKGNKRFYGKTFVADINLERIDENQNRLKDYRYHSGYDKIGEYAHNGCSDICKKLNKFGSHLALDSGSFRRIYCYNSYNTKEFRGFDELSNLFKDCYYYINKRKQILFDHYENRLKRKKELKNILK